MLTKVHALLADQSLRTKGLLVVLIPLVPLVLTSLLMTMTVQFEREAVAAVDRTQEVENELQKLTTLLAETEAGVRAFLLTGDEHWLDAEEESERQSQAILHRLASLIVDSEQRVRLSRVPALISRRLDVLEEVVSEARAQGRYPAIESRSRFEQGREIMGSLRREMTAMVTRQVELLATRQAQTEGMRRILLGTAWLGAAFGVAGGAVAVMLFTASVSSRVRTVQTGAEHLSRGAPLPELPGGRDEVGQLGRQLQLSAALLAEREQALQRRSAELAAANRELEAFSYSVSHDLRAPLRSIDGFSQVILEDCGDKLDAEGRDSLQRVRAAATRMSALIDALLVLSRMSRVELRAERVDLSAIAQAIALDLRRAEPARQVEVVIQPAMTVGGDARLLRAVLENLFGNAWKFTSKKEAARIEFGCSDEANEKVYFVRDDGAGFDMVYVNKLFGAFQRLHDERQFSGTGVGLATVQRIIHRHGGRSWAEGAIDRGATFYFTLGDLSPDDRRDIS